MTQTLLIANRGEIARRIIRTARRMGHHTVAVYSDADRNAPHVRDADTAVHIGAAPAAQSYLVIDKIIDAAKQTGAAMIHPGYGFLSENTAFAQACADNGIIFVGAPAAAINAMGLKDAAKDLMAQAGVPVVPGYNGEDQSPSALAAAAKDIGFPVIIKAVAGGGGKGMRIVQDAADFLEQLSACKGEAMRAFGNDHVLVEKYINAPRHVEVQVLSDTHGNHVHLFDRDCSIQRRHQKIIEEAPAPGIPAAVREAMYAAAVQAAKAVDYVGAGTIEFIMDAQSFDFYFMEMNTRLQVEHPVTEEITGVDLVEWQLRVAMGEAIPLAQDEINQSGHAIEVRLYAEDPDAGFLPSTGQLETLRLVQSTARLRVETGVETGSVVTPFYDPMIAKVIAHDTSRTAAKQAVIDSLYLSEIKGLKNNRAFLVRILSTEAFEKAALTTAFLSDHAQDVAPAEGAPDHIWRVAAQSTLMRQNGKQYQSIWTECGGFRLNGPQNVTITLCDAKGKERRLSIDADGSRYGVLENTHIGDPRCAARACVTTDTIEVRSGAQTYIFTRPDALHGKGTAQAGKGAVTAPMPGNVLSVAVSQGDVVEAGQTLLVLEAMKMEHRMTAPKTGIVTALHVIAGAQVKDGDMLIEIGDD